MVTKHRACRPDGTRAEIYFKREDLNHTGAHKINNSLGQVLLCRRMGKQRIIAETGAGQHGVATVQPWRLCSPLVTSMCTARSVLTQPLVLNEHHAQAAALIRSQHQLQLFHTTVADCRLQCVPSLGSSALSTWARR